ncbi:MAG TPA: hypothetical protein VGN69_04040 [Solirubrobacteraceae bacterium]|jgi:hypothetical protein|nr:hypothetical protein [Solirubrobacteraceae bacterium]
MWRRYRSRSFAPRRPALFGEQIGLAMVTVATIAGGIVALVLLLR